MVKALSIDALRRLNTADLTGCFGSRVLPLEELVCEQVELERTLTVFDAYEELVMRMTVEEYSQRQIAMECSVSVKTVSRIQRQLRWTLLTFDPRRHVLNEVDFNEGMESANGE